ncbi:MAG: 2OG-Fe(II) oxygenase [Nitrospira sp.]|nr:2OG-Fe(II) oxygenase [Nitrospira sp.]
MCGSPSFFISETGNACRLVGANVGQGVSGIMNGMPSLVTSDDVSTFSFRSSPVLVIENFWSAEERQFFRDGMNQAAWKSLSDLPSVREDFPQSGNWAKAEIGSSEGQRFLSRIQFPFIQDHIESFPDIVGRHLGFSYYSYAAGDCLLTHDDTDQGRPIAGRRTLHRRIAVVTYVHEEWQPDWGGELILYTSRSGGHAAQPDLFPTHCIEPRPGSLVMFTVPRFHRVCRVDATAGQHRRLSIAGWFMTEHA